MSKSYTGSGDAIVGGIHDSLCRSIRIAGERISIGPRTRDRREIARRRPVRPSQGVGGHPILQEARRPRLGARNSPARPRNCDRPGGGRSRLAAAGSETSADRGQARRPPYRPTRRARHGKGLAPLGRGADATREASRRPVPWTDPFVVLRAACFDPGARTLSNLSGPDRCLMRNENVVVFPTGRPMPRLTNDRGRVATMARKLASALRRRSVRIRAPASLHRTSRSDRRGRRDGGHVVGSRPKPGPHACHGGETSDASCFPRSGAPGRKPPVRTTRGLTASDSFSPVTCSGASRSESRTGRAVPGWLGAGSPISTCCAVCALQKAVRFSWCTAWIRTAVLRSM